MTRFHMLPLVLVVCQTTFQLAALAAPLAAPAAVSAAPAEATTHAAAAPAEAADAAQLRPPPSTYDLQRGRAQAGALDPEEEALFKPALRMLVALFAVLVLIYFFAKVALPRLMRGKLFAVGGQGKKLKIVEKAQLDARHALHWVELEGGTRLLLGTGGERGVQLICRLDRDNDDLEDGTPGRRHQPDLGHDSFSNVLGEVANRDLLTPTQRDSGDRNA